MNMVEGGNIPGLVTTAQAAGMSGLTPHRIGCLARAGEVEAVKVGNTLLVDVASLRAYATANMGRGRPLDARSAHAALWLLSGLGAGWLEYTRLRRLRIRLRQYSAEELSWRVRKRARVKRFRASASFLGEIRGSLILSGASSPLAGDFGLLPAVDAVEGYCLEEEAGELEARFSLAEDAHGNVVIHVAPWLPDALDGEMPVGVVAADLAQSPATREREAGFAMIRRLLDGCREVQDN